MSTIIRNRTAYTIVTATKIRTSAALANVVQHWKVSKSAQHLPSSLKYDIENEFDNLRIILIT